MFGMFECFVDRFEQMKSTERTVFLGNSFPILIRMNEHMKNVILAKDKQNIKAIMW